MGAPATPARIAGLLLLLSAGSAPGQESPRAIIERAIAAHGGAEHLERLRCEKVSMQGKILLGGKDVLAPFTAETLLQLPGRLKQVARVGDAPDKSHTLLQLVDGDRVLVADNGQPLSPTPAALSEMRVALDLQRAARLLPLLSDRAYQLSVLGVEKVNDRSAIGLKVSMKGHKDLRLYFDQQTGLLIKTEHARDDGNGKELLQEGFYGDFKDFGGFRHWTRMVIFRGGKKIVEAEVVEVKYFDKIDESEFTKP